VIRPDVLETMVLYVNRAALFEIVSWFYNEAPAQCWGSKERYVSWMGCMGMEGIYAAIEKTKEPEEATDGVQDVDRS